MKPSAHWVLPAYMVCGGYMGAGIGAIIDTEWVLGILRIILSLVGVVCLWKFEGKYSQYNKESSK